MRDFFRRLKALTYKEYLQLIRDRSSVVIGIFLPALLIVLVGFGLSLDVKHVPVAVVMEDRSPITRDILSFMDGSEYISPVYVTSMKDGETLMNEREVNVILRILPDFTRQLQKGDAKVQIILWGVDAATARVAGSYIESGIAGRVAAYMEKQGGVVPASGFVEIVPRQWFNDANTSTWFFIPGLVVLIMTLVGVFLTTMVMAREWERGTLEALFISPVKPLEILIAKIIPYFCTAMVGFSLCLLASYYIYHVPLRGSFLVILASSVIYLFSALGIGLTISTLIKNQFVSCQVALLVSMLPTMMLSGFIFDLRSVPAFISFIGHLLPATYYMELLKSLFLAGNDWPLIIKNTTILLLYALFFTGLSYKVTRKRLE